MLLNAEKSKYINNRESINAITTYVLITEEF